MVKSVNNYPTVLISSMGRSGSTWLADLLNAEGKYKVVFEPFFPARVEAASLFGYYRYLNIEETSEELLQAAETIFNGEVDNEWVNKLNNDHNDSANVLVKSIRSNLMLEWINHHFPAIKIILLVRDPFQVAESWVRLGWGNIPKSEMSDLEAILSQEPLQDDFPEIKALTSSFQSENLFESIVLEWSILNHVPLKQAELEKVSFLLVNYNDIIVNPVNELKRIFDFIESDFSESEVFKKYSKRSVTSFAKHTGGEELTDLTRERCLAILDSFKDTNLKDFISSTN